MKKSYVVIGMGRFGTSVAERLYELGNEVLAIDTNPDKVQRMESKVTCAVVADVRDEEVLRSLGARSCDCAVVAIGSDLATCIIATLNLKDLGVPQVICKATDELRKKALEKVGADRVVIPERETGFEHSGFHRAVEGLRHCRNPDAGKLVRKDAARTQYPRKVRRQYHCHPPRRKN